MTDCSVLDAAGLTVAGAFDDSKGEPDGYGILIDRSSASLGLDLEEKGIIVIDSKRGIWIQGIGASALEPDQSVTLEGVEVSGCYGVGIGFDLEAKGIIVVDNKVADTFYSMLPVETGIQDEVGAPADVGIGVVWKAGSAVTIDGLEVSGSAGHGLLIDGAVGEGSSLANVTLSGGDEAAGIVQQQVGAEDLAPTTGGGVGEIETTSSKVAEVPVAPELPAATQ